MADQEPDASLEERHNSYERKLDAKRDRLLERADKAEREGDSRIARASNDASVIPLGQPILVGHHSEKRDRNFRKRIHNNFSKGIALKEKASKLRDSRRSSVGKAGVSSDDPDAVVKLVEKLQQLEQKQQLYKSINKALKKADKHRQRRGAEELWGSATRPLPSSRLPTTPAGSGIPSYQFSATTTRTCAGSASGSRRCRATAHDVTNTEKHGDIEIVDNVEENRVQIFFPGKPDRDTRQQLKSYGFRWSPTAGAWQRHRSDTIGRVSAAVWSNAMTASWPLGTVSMPRGFFLVCPSFSLEHNPNPDRTSMPPGRRFTGAFSEVSALSVRTCPLCPRKRCQIHYDLRPTSPLLIPTN